MLDCKTRRLGILSDISLLHPLVLFAGYLLCSSLQLSSIYRHGYVVSFRLSRRSLSVDSTLRMTIDRSFLVG